MRRIVVWPDPDLEMRSREVEAKDGVIDDEILQIAMEMDAFVSQGGGLGLSAVQIGSLSRVIAFDREAAQFDKQYKKVKGAKPLPFGFLVNPVVVEVKQPMEPVREGCLSVPKVEIEVLRPQGLLVEGLVLVGDNLVGRRIQAGGLLASVLAHEIDHLNGRLIVHFLDKVNRAKVRRRLLGLSQD